MCRIQEWQLLQSYFLSYHIFDHFRCNFVSCLYFEYPLEYNHDTSQLCRTGHDDVSRTRMTTLAFLLSELFPLDGFRCNFVNNVKTVWNIIIILHSCVEQVMTMCLVQE